MWRASFIPNISLIAKDGKEPLKLIVTEAEACLS